MTGLVIAVPRERRGLRWGAAAFIVRLLAERGRLPRETRAPCGMSLQRRGRGRLYEVDGRLESSVLLALALALASREGRSGAEDRRAGG